MLILIFVWNCDGILRRKYSLFFSSNFLCDSMWFDINFVGWLDVINWQCGSFCKIQKKNNFRWAKWSISIVLHRWFSDKFNEPCSIQKAMHLTSIDIFAFVVGFIIFCRCIRARKPHSLFRNARSIEWRKKNTTKKLNNESTSIVFVSVAIAAVVVVGRMGFVLVDCIIICRWFFILYVSPLTFRIWLRRLINRRAMFRVKQRHSQHT